MKNHNRALGFISSDSKYCKILHADDWIFPTCIESMVKIAEENHRIAIVGSYGLWGNEVACDGLPYPEKIFDGKEICRKTLQGEIYPFLSPSSTMIRSDIVRKKSNFYNESNLHADVEVCYEILNSNDFGFVHQILTYIRRHDQSLTSSIAYKHDMLLYSNMDLLLKFGPKYLNKEKFLQIMSQKINRYYKVLGQNRFKKMPKGYHEFHRKKLSEMGLKYDYLKIGYYAIKYLIGEIGSKVYH
jgi:glycosyltransferase involved in cell wall biosynthesis